MSYYNSTVAHTHFAFVLLINSHVLQLFEKWINIVYGINLWISCICFPLECSIYINWWLLHNPFIIILVAINKIVKHT